MIPLDRLPVLKINQLIVGFSATHYIFVVNTNYIYENR